MQQFLSGPGPTNGGNSRPQTIVITALTLLALAGLLTGFTIGGFVAAARLDKPKTPQVDAHSAVGQTPTTLAITPTQTVQKQRLGCPLIKDAPGEGRADGTTSYSFVAQVLDHPSSQGACDTASKPLKASGITCKLWLSEIPKKGQPDVPNDMRADVQKLKTQTAPGEIPDGLNFDNTTSKTQLCDDQGQGKWKFSIASSVKPGTYYLVIVTDWDGAQINWSWTPITVKKAG
jgi:hypothetical protein